METNTNIVAVANTAGNRAVLSGAETYSTEECAALLMDVETADGKVIKAKLATIPPKALDAMVQRKKAQANELAQDAEAMTAVIECITQTVNNIDNLSRALRLNHGEVLEMLKGHFSELPQETRNPNKPSS